MYYDKNKPSGDAVQQYEILLKMLETDEEFINVQKKLHAKFSHVVSEEEKANRFFLKQFDKLFRKIKREQDREIEKLMNSLKIKI